MPDNFGVCYALLFSDKIAGDKIADFKSGNIRLSTLTFSLNVNQIYAWLRDLRLQGDISRTIDLIVGTPEIDEISEKKKTNQKSGQHEMCSNPLRLFVFLTFRGFTPTKSRLGFTTRVHCLNICPCD